MISIRRCNSEWRFRIVVGRQLGGANGHRWWLQRLVRLRLLVCVQPTTARLEQCRLPATATAAIRSQLPGISVSAAADGQFCAIRRQPAAAAAADARPVQRGAQPVRDIGAAAVCKVSSRDRTPTAIAISIQ